VTVFKTAPQTIESADKIISPVANMAVGNRGTNPVSMYVNAIGIEIPIATNIKIAAITEKNVNGRSVTKSLVIVPRIRNPSLYVIV